MHTVTVCRDSDDNIVIQTAIAGRARYIVSGDKDLLALHNYDSIQIVKPAVFLQLTST